MTSNTILVQEQRWADSYRLLAACFYQPERGMFVEEKVCESLGEVLSHLCPEAEEAATKMGNALVRTNDEDLSVEYARLFVGPFELAAPPYGSVYLEKQRRVMGETTMATLKKYQEAGLFLDADLKEPPDHIALELEFMHYLSARISGALQGEDGGRVSSLRQRRTEFLDSFLGQWVGPFCASIKEATENDYYRALSDCLTAVIACAETGPVAE